jgi:hypothetical protein
MTPSPRWLASFHEAGHVVVATVLGNRVAEVWIRDDGGGLCRQGPSVYLNERTRAVRFHTVTVAGKVSAARQFGPIGYSGSTGDYLIAREYPIQLDEGERRAVWRLAERIVVENWSAIDRVARALHREGRLDRKRIIEILQPKRGGLARRAKAAA